MKFRILILLTCCVMTYLLTDHSGEIQIVKSANLPAEKPPMFVLQVGISKYKNSAGWPELKGAVTDVRQMAEVLKSPRFGVPENNIKTLVDIDATKEKIFAAFETQLIAKAKDYFENNNKRRDAVVMFQFSGHGSQVKDVAPNKDEADGWDETFVTVNSEDKPNKNFDITDDEIYELTKRLGQYTENIVFILDSCHSGSGTRDGAESRNIEPRQTQPVFVPFSGANARGKIEKKTEKDNDQTDVLPLSENYIVISAAQAGERAGEYRIFADGAKLPTAYHGRMTYYLLKNLRDAGETTTYRDLMDAVKRDVVSDSNNKQTPQIEGEYLRPVFGGLSKIEDNTIQITINEKKEIFLEAGAMQGVVKGTILEIRSKTGEKIGTAKVSKAVGNRAVFEIIKSDRELTKDDRAVVISQDLSSFRVQVLLDGDDRAKLTPKDVEMIKKLSDKFAPRKKDEIESHGIDLASGKWNDRAVRWDIALLKDRFDKVFPDTSRAAPVEIGKKENGLSLYEAFPSGETQVFYLAGKDLSPIYGFYVEANKSYTERTLEKALLQLVRLRSVKAIANDKSPLYGKINIKPVRLISPTCKNAVIVADKKETPLLKKTETAYKFMVDELFQLEITNTYGKDLYITVLDIGSDGSVKILFPRNLDGEMNGFKLAAKTGKRIVPSEKCGDGILVITPPAGIETFKVIATTESVPRRNYEFLEMKSLNAKRRGEETSLASVGDWTTDEINFELSVPKE